MTLDLDELERLLKAATPGPWSVSDYLDDGRLGLIDADLLVALRNQAPAMLEELRSLRRQVANWERKEVQRASCCTDNEREAERLAEALNEASVALEANAVIIADLRAALRASLHRHHLSCYIRTGTDKIGVTRDSCICNSVDKAAMELVGEWDASGQPADWLAHALPPEGW